MYSDGYYRIDNETRRGMVWLAWVQSVCGFLQVCVGTTQIILVSSGIVGTVSGVLLMLHSIFTLCGVGLCVVGVVNRRLFRYAHVRLRPDGIVVHEWRDRLIPWSDIAGVQPRRQGRFQTVEVTLASGRRKVLPAPVAPCIEGGAGAKFGGSLWLWAHAR